MRSLGVCLGNGAAEVKLAPSPGQTTVMVIEDDDALRELVVTFLMDEGYRVVGASNGIRALELLRREQPSVILLDDRMPQMDGWTFWKELNALPGAAGIPVVWTSADPTVRERVEELGCCGCLMKPYTPEDLVAAVRRYVFGAAPGWTVIDAPNGDVSIELAWESDSDRGVAREWLEPGQSRRVPIPSTGEVRLRIGQEGWMTLRRGEHGAGR